MSIYKELIETVDRNHLTIRKRNVYDSQSGSYGIDYNVYDKDTFIVNLSINGYCLSEGSVKSSLEKIRRYISLRDMSTLKDFRVWLDENVEEE